MFNFLPYHPTWEILDSTKLGRMMTCDRLSFFMDICGLQPIQESIHLNFGTAWHSAKEHLLWCHEWDGKPGYPAESLRGAVSAFQDEWREHYSGDIGDAKYPHKSLSSAVIALESYIRKHTYEEPDDFKVIYTEIAGSLELNEFDKIHFRLDGLLESSNGFIIPDHKTASSGGDRFKNSWDMHLQFAIYVLAVSAFLENKPNQRKLPCVLVDGTIFTKVPKHERVVFALNIEQLNAWIVQIHQLIARFYENLEFLEHEDIEALDMSCYPRRTVSCQNYYGRPCPFKEICWMGKNPLKLLAEGSPHLNSFKQEYWNPMDLSDGARTNLEI